MKLSDELIGRNFGPGGQYRIEKKLGEGGMGVVFKATDVPNSRVVALKFLRTDGAVDADLIARFKNEGTRCAAVRHPNVVRIFALGREEGALYIATEFIEGANLYQLMVKGGGPFAVDRALAVIADSARGLKEAHRMGVVHRDLKPENIMVRDADGVVKVLDFGIAKDLHASIAMTRPGMYMGTAGYSAPEQIRGDAVDARTDIFSLGVILYELLTGKVAFDAKRTSEILRRTVAGDPVSPARLNTAVTLPVTGLIEAMMRKNPAKRIATCDEVVEKIEAVRAYLKAGCTDEEQEGIRNAIGKLISPK
jgi:eukaryotic-like serine/threonine-protein kinase